MTPPYHRPHSRLPYHRLQAALRRYGRAATLHPPAGDRSAPRAIHLLISDLSALRHSDLPSDGISAEALALVPQDIRPRDGQRILAADTGWRVLAALPLDDGDLPTGRRLYQLQLAGEPAATLPASPLTPTGSSS